MAKLQPHHKGSKGKHPPLSSRKHNLPKKGRGSIKRVGKRAAAGAKRSHQQLSRGGKSSVARAKKSHKQFVRAPGKAARGTHRAAKSVQAGWQAAPKEQRETVKAGIAGYAKRVAHSKSATVAAQGTTLATGYYLVRRAASGAATGAGKAFNATIRTR